ARRVGLRVLRDDRDRVGLATDLDALLQRLAELGHDPGIRLAEGSQRARQRAEEADAELVRLGDRFVRDADRLPCRRARDGASDDQTARADAGLLDDVPPRVAR